MRQRSPSFDGIHAMDYLNGIVMRGSDNNDYIIEDNTWKIHEYAVYETIIRTSSLDQEITIAEIFEKPRVKRVKLIPMPILDNFDDGYVDGVYNHDIDCGDFSNFNCDKGPKKRGRPAFVKHGTRLPTNYNIFVKHEMLKLPEGLTNNERMRECAVQWKKYKETNKTLSE